MNKALGVLEQALEALEWADNFHEEGEPVQIQIASAIAALKEAIKQHGYEKYLTDLAQAAALAVKQSRDGSYVGAWVVANQIIKQDAEIAAHRTRILGIKDGVHSMLKEKPE